MRLCECRAMYVGRAFTRRLMCDARTGQGFCFRLTGIGCFVSVWGGGERGWWEWCGNACVFYGNVLLLVGERKSLILEK